MVSLKSLHIHTNLEFVKNRQTVKKQRNYMNTDRYMRGEWKLKQAKRYSIAGIRIATFVGILY